MLTGWAIFSSPCISAVPVESRDSLLVERQTHDRKIASSNPSRSGGRFFFSMVNCACRLLFGVHSNPVLPRSFCQKCRLRLNTHTPSAQRSQSGLTMPLYRHRVGTYQETSSQATSQGTLGHREHSATVISARWATVDWSWPKEWN